MLKKLFRLWPFVAMAIPIFAFHSQLFFPQLSTYATPDYGLSDAIHISLTNKFLFSENIRNLTFPTWIGLNSQGYPLFTETLDMLYLPNLIAFFVLPFKLAVPFNFLATFLIAAFSMYALCRYLKFTKEAAVLCGLTFAFSSALILRVQHQAIANAISIFPLALIFTLKIQNKFSLSSLVILGFLLSQMTLSFPQVGIYAILLTLLLGIFLQYPYKLSSIPWFILKNSLLAIIIFLFSAVYIVPLFQHVGSSGRSGGIKASKILNEYPYTFQSLATFLNPFYFGNPSTGTYKYIKDLGTKGIYWENTGYFGVLPFFFALAGTTVLIIKRRNHELLIISSLGIITILLALGKYAPFHFIYAFPPLNYFRVIARFILFSQVFLIVSFGSFLTFLSSKPNGKIAKILFSLLFIILLSDFYFRWKDYNLIIPINDILKKPEILENVKLEPERSYQFLTINSSESWNDVFLNKGWQKDKENYKFFLNSLQPNLNVFLQQKSISAYQVLPTKRQGLQQSLLRDGISDSDNEYSLDESYIRTLNVYSIKYLISPKKLTSNNLSLIKQVSRDKYNFYLYENPQAKEKFQLYYEYITIKNSSDYLDLFKKTDLNNVVLIEKGPSRTFQKSDNNRILYKTNSNTHVSLQVITNSDAILVANISNNPGWTAKIDNQKTEIIKANINSQAIIVPKGDHEIEFRYVPLSFYLGASITFLTFIVSAFLLIKLKFFKFLVLPFVK